MTEPSGSTQKSREAWIDALRGFIMLLMVFGHVWAGLEKSGILQSRGVFQAVYNTIYFFHMPALFVISGLLFSGTKPSRGFWQDNGRRAVRFLYPLVLWSYIYFLTKYFAAGDVNTPISLDGVLHAPFPPKDHFWFIWALFLVQTAAALLVAAGASNRIALGATGLVLALVLILAPSIWTSWTAPAFRIAPFYFVGVLLGGLPLRESSNPAYAAAGAILFVLLPTLAIMAGTPGPELVVLLLQSICIIGLILFSVWLGKHFGDHPVTRGLCLVGQAAMTIYLLHIFFTSGLRILLVRLHVDNLSLHIIAGTAVGLLLPLAIHVWAGRGRARTILGI